jgi:hypothetical protein
METKLDGVVTKLEEIEHSLDKLVLLKRRLMI